MKLDRERSFGKIIGEPYQPAGCDRPAHFDQDGRLFDAQEHEIVRGPPPATNGANVSDATEPSVMRPIDKTANTKETESRDKLIIVMAVAAYKYDPAALRNAAIPEIVDDAHALGLSIDEDTVRKFVRRAAEYLPTRPTEET